jgi:hypothetical protein
MGTADEVARAARFLLSEDSMSYLTMEFIESPALVSPCVAQPPPSFQRFIFNTAASRAAPVRDAGSKPVTQPQAVETVTVMSNAFDCMQVHQSMPSDLDKRIAP